MVYWHAADKQVLKHAIFTTVKNPELGWWHQPKFFSLTEIFVEIVLNVLQICLAWLYLYLRKTIKVSLGIFRFMNYVQLESVLNYNLLLGVITDYIAVYCSMENLPISFFI